MKWTDPRLVKACLTLTAIASLIVSILAELKWR